MNRSPALFQRLLSLFLLGLIVSVAVHYRQSLREVLNGSDYRWLIPGLLCYLGNYLSRAWRIATYLDHAAPLFPDLFRISCLHGFSSYFLPMRSGDLALPMFLKNDLNVPLARGARILFRARLLDLLGLGLLLFWATLFTSARIALSWRLVFAGLGMGLAALPYLLIRLSRLDLPWLQDKLARLRGAETGLIRYPVRMEVFQSLLIWFWTGCSTYCVVRALQIPLSFLDVWFFAAVQLPLQLLPVQGLANSGNHEAGWLIALDLLGITAAAPMTLALASHLLLMCYVLALGLAVLFLGPFRKQRLTDRSASGS